MASIASRSASALRAASRRAPRAGAKIAAKPAQTASYSLLARQVAAGSSRKSVLQVKKANNVMIRLEERDLDKQHKQYDVQRRDAGFFTALENGAGE